MNNIIKATIATLAISALAGCASIPQAPKNAQEMAALGDDNLLNVPVDITGFPWKKQEIVAANGDKGIVTVFTDPKNGKTYDLDGQAVNAKAERVLKNGYVCEASSIGSFNQRVYGGWGFNKAPKECITEAASKDMAERNKVTPTKLATAFLIGGTAGAAGVAVSTGSVAVLGVSSTVVNATVWGPDTSGDTL